MLRQCVTTLESSLPLRVSRETYSSACASAGDSMPDEPEDFVENVKRADAAEAARQRAIAPAQRPRRRTNAAQVGGYVGQALSNEAEQLRSARTGTRNDILNTAGFNLGQLVGAGGLEFDVVVRELTSAALDAGLTRGELKQWDLPERAIRDGMAKPRDLSELDSAPTTSRPVPKPPRTAQQGDASDWDDDERRIVLKRMSSVKMRVPQWVWEYEKVGRIQLRTLAMFAGKPGAGKSTAVRWFAARLSRGELPGVWEDYPMNVAVVMTEEHNEDMIAPSLYAAGADMRRVYYPEITEGGSVGSFASIRDEQNFTEQLIDNEIRAVFIDPVMSTVDGKMDAYRNNEVRQHLQPFVRIAQAINGIVVCVTHFRKGLTDDVMAGITGSSAFGEVPRSVFGFAPGEGGAHILEQVKNSAGPTGLKLEYHLPIEYIPDEDGLTFELPRFEIRGETEVSIADVNQETGELTGIAFASEWLTYYLMENQPAPVWQVQKDAKSAGAINNDKMLSRASKRIGVVSKSQPVKDKPNQHVWMLPEFAKNWQRWKGDS